MNNGYINNLLTQLLCTVNEIKSKAIHSIVVFFNGEIINENTNSIDFTGDVTVTNTSTGVVVDVNGGTTTDFAFDADRPITRDVLGLLGENLGTQGVLDTLEELLYPYLAPTITLSAPSNSVFEKTTGTTNITVTATSVKNTDDIVSLKFFLGATEIYDEGTVNVSGQTSSYVNATANTDGTTATPVFQVFKAVVDDGTTAVDSNTRTRTLVYPYFYGSDVTTADDLTIMALTKHVAVAGEKNYTFSPSNEKIYIAYPAVYGNLVEINDGALNLTSAFTLRTDTFTMADSQVVTYNIYESNNLLTISGYELNFIL